MKQIVSEAKDGLATVQIEFEPDVDADRKEDEVMRDMNSLRPDLPSGLARLTVQRASTSNVSILQVAIVSDVAPYAQLDSLGKQLEDRLAKVKGIKKAERWAAPDRELQVNVDLARLAQLGIAPEQLFRSVASDNVTIPGGSVDAGGRRFNVTPQGRYRTPEELKQTVVGAGPRGLVHVADVARVEWGYGDATHIGRWNGHRAVFVTTAMQDGFNIADVDARMKPELDAFEK